MVVEKLMEHGASVCQGLLGYVTPWLVTRCDRRERSQGGKRKKDGRERARITLAITRCLWD